MLFFMIVYSLSEMLLAPANNTSYIALSHWCKYYYFVSLCYNRNICFQTPQ